MKLRIKKYRSSISFVELAQIYFKGSIPFRYPGYPGAVDESCLPVEYYLCQASHHWTDLRGDCGRWFWSHTDKLQVWKKYLVCSHIKYNASGVTQSLRLSP